MDERIENTVVPVLRRANLLRSGVTLLVALSGGADSVVLLRAVCALGRRYGLTIRAAHVEHGLRGVRALADAQFCERLCADLGVPLSVDHAGLPGDMHSPGAETRARAARYRLLLGRARDCRADALLLAHHQDDQAETVLARLIRGSGAQGLSGMREISRMEGVTLARPLLTLPKQTLLEALGGLPYCEDETNAQPCCQRNRLRAEVLPLLTAENPQAAAHIARSAALLAMDADCLQAQAEALLSAALVDRPPYLYVRRSALRGAPPAVAVRVLRAFALLGVARLQTADGTSRRGRLQAATADAILQSGRSQPTATNAVSRLGRSQTDPVGCVSGSIQSQFAPVDAISASRRSQPAPMDVVSQSGWSQSAPTDAVSRSIQSQPTATDAAATGMASDLAIWPLPTETPDGESAFSAEDSLSLLVLLNGPESGKLNLPCALRAAATAHHLHLVRMDGGGPLTAADAPQPLAFSPADPGRETCFGDLRLRLSPWDTQTGPCPDGLRTVALPDDRLTRAVLRLPRPGDTIRPFGAGGSKPLRRYLTDRKLDPPFRPRLPVLCDGAEVLWMIGLGASEATRLCEGPATLLTAEGWLPWAEETRKND